MTYFAIVLLLLAVFLSVPVLWVLYLAVMNLQRARDAGTISHAVYRTALTLQYIGLFLDFVCNAVPFAILFVELPREWLVTSRIQRHASDSTGWRKSLAVWVAVNWLNPFSQSPHIKL